MLKRPDIQLTPTVIKMLNDLFRVSKRQFSYASIGQPIPGVMRAAPRGYVYYRTGETLPMTVCRLAIRQGRLVREPEVYNSPVVTLLDVRLTKAQRMARRKAEGLPEHP